MSALFGHVEDYLKVIYGHTEWQPDPITPSQLAARLGLAPSTVTEMVKKLVARTIGLPVWGTPAGSPATSKQSNRTPRSHRQGCSPPDTFLLRRLSVSGSKWSVGLPTTPTLFDDTDPHRPSSNSNASAGTSTAPTRTLAPIRQPTASHRHPFLMGDLARICGCARWRPRRIRRLAHSMRMLGNQGGSAILTL